MIKEKVLIKNAKAIVCCDYRDQVFREADILIQGEEILEIGKNIECELSLIHI